MFGQSAERVAQADLKPKESRSQKGVGRRGRVSMGLVRVAARKVGVIRGELGKKFRIITKLGLASQRALEKLVGFQ